MIIIIIIFHSFTDIFLIEISHKKKKEKQTKKKRKEEKKQSKRIQSIMSMIHCSLALFCCSPSCFLNYEWRKEKEIVSFRSLVMVT